MHGMCGKFGYREAMNEYPHQENKTRVTRALKPQRNCPKSKNEDFLWN